MGCRYGHVFPWPGDLQTSAALRKMSDEQGLPVLCEKQVETSRQDPHNTQTPGEGIGILIVVNLLGGSLFMFILHDHLSPTLMKKPEPAGSGKESLSSPDITPLLHVLGYFHPVSSGIEAFLKEHVTSCTARKRKLLLKEGVPCKYVYFLVKGAVRGFRREGQKDITTWIVIENELVSSIFSLDEPAPSIENIQALENCELLALSYESLNELYDQYPEFNLIARKLLQRYYADAERRAFIARLTKAENKYRHFLLLHPSLSNRIPLKYIASYLGMTLETLSRVRKKFTRERLG
jgi:CRP-like cAMP-binding protein